MLVAISSVLSFKRRQRKKGCGNDGRRGAWMAAGWHRSCRGNPSKANGSETARPNSGCQPAGRLVLGTVVLIWVFQIACTTFSLPYAWFLVLPYPKFLHPATVSQLALQFHHQLAFPCTSSWSSSEPPHSKCCHLFSLMLLVCLSFQLPLHVLCGRPCRAVACLPSPQALRPWRDSWLSLPSCSGKGQSGRTMQDAATALHST